VGCLMADVVGQDLVCRSFEILGPVFVCLNEDVGEVVLIRADPHIGQVVVSVVKFEVLHLFFPNPLMRVSGIPVNSKCLPWRSFSHELKSG